MGKILRIYAKEYFETSGGDNSDEPYSDQGHTDIMVEFNSFEICDKLKEGGYDAHYILSDSDKYNPKYPKYSIYQDFDWSKDYETLWFIICRYSDGDSFSSCSGNWEVIAVFDDEEKMHTWLDNNKAMCMSRHDGYFDHTESIEEIELTVNQKGRMRKFKK